MPTTSRAALALAALAATASCPSSDAFVTAPALRARAGHLQTCRSSFAPGFARVGPVASSSRAQRSSASPMTMDVVNVGVIGAGRYVERPSPKRDSVVAVVGRCMSIIVCV